MLPNCSESNAQLLQSKGADHLSLAVFLLSRQRMKYFILLTISIHDLDIL